MKHIVELPNDTITLRYSDKVYAPTHSMVDPIVIADRFIQGTETVLDVGCGSGVLGLSLKKMNPEAQVTLCDIDPKAVHVAKINAKQLKLDVSVVKRGIEHASKGWDLIIANLPTFDATQMKEEVLHGPEVSYKDEGLELYAQLFDQAKTHILVCECQTKRQKEFLKLAEDRGWKLILRTDYGFAFSNTV